MVLQTSKALYGLLRSILLLYRKLRCKLEAYGYKINPYDTCVGNKMVMTDTVVPVIDKKLRPIQKKRMVQRRCAK